MMKAYRGSRHCGAVRFEAARLTITYIDGMNDRFETPAFVAHL
jgi:hypothetical protein